MILNCEPAFGFIELDRCQQLTITAEGELDQITLAAIVSALTERDDATFDRWLRDKLRLATNSKVNLPRAARVPISCDIRDDVVTRSLNEGSRD
jgi:hypothetical protein